MVSEGPGLTRGGGCSYTKKAPGSPDSGTNPRPSRTVPALSACHFVSDEAVRMEPGVEHGGCANGQIEGGEVERGKGTVSSTWEMWDFRWSVGVLKWSRSSREMWSS